VAKLHGGRWFVGDGEIRPGLHQTASYLEQIAAAVGRLDFVADGMSERHFGGLGGKIRLLGPPIAKSSAPITVECCG
jgi:hypothetical protein